MKKSKKLTKKFGNNPSKYILTPLTMQYIYSEPKMLICSYMCYCVSIRVTRNQPV